MKAVHLLSDVHYSLRGLFFRFSNCTLNVMLRCHQNQGEKALRVLYFFFMIRLSMRPLKHSLEASRTQKMRGKIIGQNETFRGERRWERPSCHTTHLQQGHFWTPGISGPFTHAFLSQNNHFGFNVILSRFPKSGRSSSGCVLLPVAAKQIIFPNLLN